MAWVDLAWFPRVSLSRLMWQLGYVLIGRLLRDGSEVAVPMTGKDRFPRALGLANNRESLDGIPTTGGN